LPGVLTRALLGRSSCADRQTRGRARLPALSMHDLLSRRRIAVPRRHRRRGVGGFVSEHRADDPNRSNAQVLKQAWCRWAEANEAAPSPRSPREYEYQGNLHRCQ
jgi:hypothetical protein